MEYAWATKEGAMNVICLGLYSSFSQCLCDNIPKHYNNLLSAETCYSKTTCYHLLSLRLYHSNKFAIGKPWILSTTTIYNNTFAD